MEDGNRDSNKNKATQILENAMRMLFAEEYGFLIPVRLRTFFSSNSKYKPKDATLERGLWVLTGVYGNREKRPSADRQFLVWRESS